MSDETKSVAKEWDGFMQRTMRNIGYGAVGGGAASVVLFRKCTLRCLHCPSIAGVYQL